MGFWTGLINDAEKQVNPAHVVTLSLTLAVIIWGCWESYHTHAMPSHLTEAAQLLGGSVAANAVHKAEDIIGKIKGTPSQLTEGS